MSEPFILKRREDRWLLPDEAAALRAERDLFKRRWEDSERIRGGLVDVIHRLRARLEQIAVVCTDNMDRGCDHCMALDFVRQIANADEQSGEAK